MSTPADPDNESRWPCVLLCDHNTIYVSTDFHRRLLAFYALPTEEISDMGSRRERLSDREALDRFLSVYRSEIGEGVANPEPEP
jgi:hypothetical protein